MSWLKITIDDKAELPKGLDMLINLNSSCSIKKYDQKDIKHGYPQFSIHFYSGGKCYESVTLMNRWYRDELYDQIEIVLMQKGQMWNIDNQTIINSNYEKNYDR